MLIRQLGAGIGAVLMIAMAGTAAHAADGPAFAAAFTDHAVLQRARPVHVWGTAAASQALTLTFGGNGADHSQTVTADAAGRWDATLPAMTAGGPYTLAIADASGHARTLSDIMVGDVYLCSGQSNMQFPGKLSTGAWSGSASAVNPNIRFLTIQNDSQVAPQKDIRLPAAWKVAGPDTTGDASAVCYYMSRALQKDQNVPIGFIDSFWGGTTIQGWISEASLRTVPAYTAGVDIVALDATDPARAQAQQSKVQEAWWDKNDPQAKADRAFIAPAFNDDAWPTMKSAGSWKASGIDALKAFDGVVWFRTTVTLTADQAKTANELTLGAIGTYDSTWINGVWVGSGGMSWLWRDYQIPAGVFKPGKNVIVLRVLSGSDDAGLTGALTTRTIKTSDGQVIALPESWKYKIAMPARGLSVPATPWAIPTSLSTLYNGMIAPISGYTVKMVAWYQGESNAGNGKEYQTLLPLMMKDWRTNFNNPDLPFLIVQLANYGPVATKPGRSDWAELREAQRLSVEHDPHAALAITVDVGDRTDIHPTQKTVVGERLARAARALVYGENVTPGGPRPVSVARAGADLVVTFTDTNGGLRTYSGATALAFEACTGPNVCDYVTAVPHDDTIILENANKPGVTSVRYAWANAPFVNLYSADDLPAVPFNLEIKP